jgi:SAM-dependent methyltransferase
MSEIPYIGNELHLFQHASNWKRYYAKNLKPFIKGDVLEVGAGIGSTTNYLYDGSQRSWLCLEPDSGLFKELETKIENKELADRCTCLKGIVSDLDPHQKFDTILYIDVIEHIEDDKAELRQAAEKLNKGGHLIVLVPAHQSLFSKFDAAIGHFRRYDKKMLAPTAPSSLQLKKIKYLDSMGLLASLANKYFLKQDYPTLDQIHFWNNLIVPVSRVTDILTNYSLGKTLIGIWQKPG